MLLHLIILVYFIVMVVVICGSGWYVDRQRRAFAADSPDDNIFRCHNCRYVYTDDPDVDFSRCPQCGKNNEVFEFC